MNHKVRLALLNLLLVSLLGLGLRGQALYPVPGINYAYWLNAHSHFALAGWAFLALFLALNDAFVPKTLRKKRSYSLLFWLIELAAFGMLASFPWEGYATVSILFSSLFLVSVCWYTLRFFRDTQENSRTVSLSFGRAGLLFSSLSGLGPLALGPIMAFRGAASPLYWDAIYFYLHFLYNGGFTFAVFALWFRASESNSGSNPASAKFRTLMVLALVPAYFLSVLWSHPPIVFYILASLGAILQLIALPYFWKSRPPLGPVWTLAAGAFSIKVLLQGLSALPIVAALAYKHRDFIIGYLHLVLLGFITLFLLEYFGKRYQVQINTYWKLGLWGLVLGIGITECLLFLQAGLNSRQGYIPEFNAWIFGSSLLLPLSLLLLLKGSFHRNPINQGPGLGQIEDQGGIS